MTAFVGALVAPGSTVSPGAWRAALDTLAIGPGTCREVGEREWLVSAIRAPDTHGYFQDETCLVGVDGSVESTPELVSALGAAAQKASGAAEAVAALYRGFGSRGFTCLKGSFAATVVDRSARQVLLVNDVLGSRGLYYAQTSFGWCWASEMKFLIPLLEGARLNREALSYVFHYRCPTLGATEIEGVRECLPAHWIRLSLDRAPEEIRYTGFTFEPRETGEERSSVLTRVGGALDEYFAGLRQRRSRIGILLSGGVDSSLLAAKAVEGGFQAVVAVTVRWQGHDSPETERSALVARKLGLAHRVIEVPDDFVAAYLGKFVWESQGAPRHFSGLGLAKIFRDTDDIDTFVSGEGADCVFGPGELLRLRQIESKQRMMPRVLRAPLGPLLPKREGGRLRRFGDLCRYEIPDCIALFNRIEYNTSPHELVPEIPETPGRDTVLESRMCAAGSAASEHYQHVHLYTVNRGHALAYHRLGSPHGITVETPFLGGLLMEVGRSLPFRHKIEGSQYKPVLRELLCRYLPREWVYWPKLGFPAPLEEWLEGPLAWWRAFLIDERTIARGLYRPEVIRRLQPACDSDLIWTALTFEVFLRQYVDGSPVATSLRAGSVK
jgi:asparagine synthase (glutamine-hydrolysing)